MLQETTVSLFSTACRSSQRRAVSVSEIEENDAENERLLTGEATPGSDLSPEIEERIKLCGQRYAARFNPADGSFKRFPFFCHEWRRCKICLDKRANQYRERLATAIFDRDVTYRILPTGEATTLLSKYNKDEYLRLPHDDGQEHVFFNAKAEDAPSPLTLEDIQTLPWSTIVYTAPGKRISGKLGNLPTTASSKNKTVIGVETIVADASEQVCEQAAANAIRATSELDPKDEDELREALSIRTNVYREQLVALGGKVELTYYMKVAVDLSKLDWSKSRRRYELSQVA